MCRGVCVWMFLFVFSKCLIKIIVSYGVFKGNCKPISKVGVPFYTPTSNVWWSQCLKSLPGTGILIVICCLVIFAFSGCGTIAHCGLFCTYNQ